MAVILGVGAAVCIVLGVAIGAAISFSNSTRESSGDQQVADNATIDAIDPELAAAAAGDLELGQPSGATAQPASLQNVPQSSEGESAKSDAALVPSPALAEVSKSISKWYEAPRTVAGLKNIMRLQVLSAWLSTDPAGGPSSNSSDAAQPQFLFVEMQITNASSMDALTYTSWNGNSPATDDIAALLFDSAGRQSALVPASKAPATGRQSSLEIKPGEVVKDVLVFEIPADRSNDLRLALPLAAFGRDGYMGFELPATMLAERTAATAPPPVAAATPAPEPSAEPISLVVEPAAPQPAKEPAKEPAPLTFDDLKRSIEKSAGQPPEEKKALSDAEQKELERLREAVKKQP